MRPSRHFLTVLIVMALAACAQTPPPAPKPAPAPAPAPAAAPPAVESFLLLPDRNGTVGQITITANGQQQVLSMASQGTSLDIATKTIAPPTIWSEDRIEEEFEDALENEPLPPKTYNLHFNPDGATLTAASKALLRTIATDALARPDYHLIVAGHSTANTTAEQNKRLSLKWALLARHELGATLDPKKMTLKAYGQSPSLAPGVGTQAVLGRRVEITVQ